MASAVHFFIFSGRKIIIKTVTFCGQRTMYHDDVLRIKEELYLILEKINYAKENNKSIFDLLETLKRKYGFYK